MSIPLSLPELPAWAAQLAGILPLTGLFELIDASEKLHSLELAAAVPLWNWPITPAMARSLFSNDNVDACYLDSVRQSQTLHCIDGRFGDLYPSSTPTTSLMCGQTRRPATVIPNQWLEKETPHGRRQKLKVIVLMENLDKPQPRLSISSNAHRWMSILGWLCWAGASITSLYARLYIAAVYLALIPLTGATIGLTHGNAPRQLLDTTLDYERMVIATHSLNGTAWYAFYGESKLLNTLLNRPLCRVDARPSGRFPLGLLLRLLIAGQWVLSVGSCALRDWNAIVIFAWLMFCTLYSAFVYPLQVCVQDWLRQSCNLSAESIDVEFTTRRSMLSALVCLNPDTKEKRTAWIDPILRQSEDRDLWETALLNYILTKRNPDEVTRNKYWWKFIEEGHDAGDKMKQRIKDIMALSV
ncbi:uncharacterized protein Triagg1_6004 [Trichoderma aggressivum f. europaeum]|uniref:Uncharacterized protein n=1 Tax=Trichoderma aggressivum f. europaeum TaxID=173218 RepID=A0AAE1J566_9HYPO|nr:hypothetical protein Triagg1_6004 [Trichoderma aggressivum f. europaeum]